MLTALCGRNKQKLEAVKFGCNCPDDVEIIVAQADDVAAIEGFSCDSLANVCPMQNSYTTARSFCEANEGGLRICRPIRKVQRFGCRGKKHVSITSIHKLLNAAVYENINTATRTQSISKATHRDMRALMLCEMFGQACVKYGTHFVDICGEPQWVRAKMANQHHTISFIKLNDHSIKKTTLP